MNELGVGRRGWLAGLGLGLLSATFGCASQEPFIWVRDLPPAGIAPNDAPYVIGPGDVLEIKVFNEDRVSAKQRVRSDGRITMPLIGDVDASGKTPLALAREVEQRLQKFLNAPTVTISVEETRPLTFTALGEVAHPGVFPITPGSGVLQALAIAGGLTELADRDSIFVVRKRPPLRIRFTYRALISNDPSAANFVLQNGDVLMVE